MHPLLPTRSGKPAFQLTSFWMGLLLASFATLTRPWRSRKPTLQPLLAGLLLATSATCLSLPTHGQTFQAVPLDCGGWFSGLAQADNGRLYGYGDVFGAWRSDDGGMNWRYLNWSMPGGDFYGTGMAVQQDNADVVYYCTSRALSKSTDGGTSWNVLLDDVGNSNDGGKTPHFRGASPILIRANNPDELWFAGPRKNQTGWLWKSSDGGGNWSKAGGNIFDSNRVRTLHNVAAFANQIWVGTDNGLYVSTDGGDNFSLVGSSGRLRDVGMIARFTSGPFTGDGLVARKNSSGGGGISRITASDYEDAATYSVSDAAIANVDLGNPKGLQIFSDGSSSAWGATADRHGFSPASNGGQTFTRRANTLNTSDVVPIWTTAAIAPQHHGGTDQVIEAVDNPNKWIMTGGKAPMYSLDKGLSWQYFPNGNGLAGVKTYYANPSRYDADRVYIPASDQGSFIVTDGGRSGLAAQCSRQTYNHHHGAFRVLEGPDTQNLVLAGVDQGANATLLLRSANGGASWDVVSQSGNGLPRSLDGVTKAVMSFADANDFLVVLASATALSGTVTPGTINPGVWRTTDGGATFRQVEDLPTTGLRTGHRYAPQSCFLERDAVQADVRYFIAQGTAFYRSTNGGTNWSARTHPFGLQTWAWDLHADPVRGDNLWVAGAGGGVKVSRDGGQSWTPTAQRINARFVSSYDGKVAVFGTMAGDTQPLLYYSTDDGETFTPLTTPTHNFHAVQGLMVDRTGKVWVSWNSVTVVTPPSATVAPTTPLITSRGENQPNEGQDKAFDGNHNTKWLDFNATSWLQIQYPSAVVHNQYVLVSGNDAPERDPRNWTVQGSQDGTAWTTLDTQDNQTWEDRQQAKTYGFSNTTPYAYYKLDITAANGGSQLQLSELTYGNSASGRSGSVLAQRSARQAGVAVFPNPARTRFTVVADDEQAHITVLSLDGRVMASGQVKTVECDTWSAGIYLVKVQSKTGLTVQKLIVTQ